MLLGVDHVLEVAVDEPTLVPLVTTAPPKPLLERRERAFVADDDDAGTPRDSRDVEPHEPAPAPGEERTRGDEEDERHVGEHHGTGEHIERHPNQRRYLRRTGEWPATLNAVRPWSERPAVRAAAAAGVLAYAWWATGRSPFTATATLAVVGAGLAAVAVGQARRPQDESCPARAGVVTWLVVLVALAGWQLLAYLQQPRSEHPTLSSLTNAALESHTGRALAFAAWLVAGSWLARR